MQSDDQITITRAPLQEASDQQDQQMLNFDELHDRH